MILHYLKAASVEEVLSLKDQYGADACFLAGGTEINRRNSFCTCSTVIDIGSIGLDRIQQDGTSVVIGAAVTFQQVLDSTLAPQELRRALGYAGSRTLRNGATIGGNLAVRRSDSYLLPLLTAAKVRLVMAELDTEGVVNRESVPVREYLDNLDLYRHSLIESIVLDKPHRFAASRRFSRSQQSPPAITVAFGADWNSHTEEISGSRVVAGTAGFGVRRLESVEQDLDGGVIRSADDLEKAVSEAVKAVDDVTGSAGYKKYLAGTALADMYSLFMKNAGEGREAE